MIRDKTGKDEEAPAASVKGKVPVGISNVEFMVGQWALKHFCLTDCSVNLIGILAALCQGFMSPFLLVLCW